MATGVDQQDHSGSLTSQAPRAFLHAEVLRQCEGWANLADAEATVEKAMSIVAAEPSLAEKRDSQGCSGFAVTVVLSDDDAVRQLNKTHRKIDKPTNVLSFPTPPEQRNAASDEATYLGDIVIAYETVIAEAEDQGRSADDHLSHLAIHGVLHVLGYDHDTEEDAHDMEQLEISLLAKLGIENPYDEKF